MKKTLAILATVATGALFVALPARADDPAAPVPADPAATTPSKAEKAHANLKEMDTNNDGKITYEEFRAAWEKRIQEMFKKLDRNGDGVLDRADRPLKGGREGGAARP